LRKKLSHQRKSFPNLLFLPNLFSFFLSELSKFRTVRPPPSSESQPGSSGIRGAGRNEEDTNPEEIVMEGAPDLENLGAPEDPAVSKIKNVKNFNFFKPI
jgi:hypothetical protein